MNSKDRAITNTKMNWLTDDGINLPMINDYHRNSFYENILKNKVNGKKCIDIGFGTGLLSIIAIKHGADHILAYEYDTDRYALGKEIISHLKLENRIELINSKFERHNIEKDRIIFTETVDQNLWGEKLWSSLPADNDVQFLPGIYFCEIWAVEIPNALAYGMINPSPKNSYFDPGIDIDTNFVKLINDLANLTYKNDKVFNKGIYNLPKDFESVWEWMPYKSFVKKGNCYARYEITNYIENTNEISLDISTWHCKKSNLLVTPRFGLQQDEHKLYLDEACWSSSNYPVVIIHPENYLKFTQNLTDGSVVYEIF